MPVTRKEVAQHLLRLQKAQTSFLGFMELHFPERTYPPFQLQLIETLDRFEKNHIEEENLLITMPPRFGKSETGTIMFPSYFMARDPSRYVMSSSYNSQLAVDFGRQIRQIVEDPLTVPGLPRLQAQHRQPRRRRLAHRSQRRILRRRPGRHHHRTPGQPPHRRRPLQK
jgi:hypothetical protein